MGEMEYYSKTREEEKEEEEEIQKQNIAHNQS